MIQFEDIKALKKEHEQTAFEPNVTRVLGVLVARDYSNSAAVQNRDGWVWWRRKDQTEGNLSQALNRQGSEVAGRPVILEQRRPLGIWEVVSTDVNQLALLDDYTGQDLDTQHADSHLPSGADPLYIYMRALMPLRTSVQTGLKVNVAPLRYQYQGSVVKFAGSNNYDLTSNVPGTANEARYVLIYLDPTTNALAKTNGATGPDSATVSLTIPTVTAGTIPSCLVRLANGQTTIAESDIIPFRLLFEPFNGLDNSRVSKIVASDGTPDPALSADAAGALTAAYQLTLAASTTSAASLNLPDGTAPTTPAQGDIYALSGTPHCTPVADDRSFNLADGVATSNTTVANTVTETTVFTESISANELHVGQVVRCHALGRYSTFNATDTFTARIKIAGTTIATLTSTAANVTDAGVEFTFTFTVRSTGVSGTVWWHASGVFNDETKTSVATSTATIDTTAADDVTVTVQWSAANASNTLTLSQGWCDFVG